MMLLSVFYLFTLIVTVLSHGRLEDPPSRNFIWRLGYVNPRNFDDNGLNCGGLANQWYKHDGKCGLCGDPYQGPRYHEAGYKGVGFANGVIGRVYKTGDEIEVKVVLTANHLGHITFAICKVNEPSESVTQKCFDENRLYGRNGQYKFPVDARDTVMRLKLQLPKSLKCDQCVMQWKYTAGNNGGQIQETFINCADVTINDKGGPQPQPPKPEARSVEEDNGPEVIDPSLLRDPEDWKCDVMYPYNEGLQHGTIYQWCIDNCLLAKPNERTCPATHCFCIEKNPKNGEKPRNAAEPWLPDGPPVKLIRDKADHDQAEKERRAKLMKEWTCEVVAPYDATEDVKKQTYEWCLESCVFANHHHSNCAPTHCRCSEGIVKSTHSKPIWKPIRRNNLDQENTPSKPMKENNHRSNRKPLTRRNRKPPAPRRMRYERYRRQPYFKWF